MGEGEGGLINFPPLKRGGLLERGGLIEDLRYVVLADLLVDYEAKSFRDFKPFPSSKDSHFKTLVKMSFICMRFISMALHLVL